MSNNEFAQALSQETIGCRLQIERLGQSKTLESDKRQQAASVFGTDSDFFRASKKLFNSKHPEYKAVTRILSRARAFWKESTLPYTEAGVRLLKRCDVNTFTEQMEGFQRELDNEVESLNLAYAQLLQEAEERLGELYDESDYPPTLVGKFSLLFDFPSLAASEHLAAINPVLYERECERIRNQFEQAAQLAETAFAEELQKLINKITEVLASKTEDGKQKVFRDSTVENFREFFDRFRHLSIRSNEALEALVDEAKQAVGGLTGNDLRSSEVVRQDFSNRITEIGERLEDAVIARPVRRLRVSNKMNAENEIQSAEAVSA